MTVRELLGALVCKWKGKHKWGRGVDSIQRISDGGVIITTKRCRRCGTPAPVKRRKVRETK